MIKPTLLPFNISYTKNCVKTVNEIVYKLPVFNKSINKPATCKALCFFLFSSFIYNHSVGKFEACQNELATNENIRRKKNGSLLSSF